ncbi:magnesium-translocating P-type ATPase [Actinoplanes sp. NPDC049316]|uniref:magnesium-translocating P-type ATPase n=1 Tax=Actinoplanes sp. NPDC049316 TaxID=3154727 RepID=UPI00342875C2
MTTAVRPAPGVPAAVPAMAAATLGADEVLRRLDASPEGLTGSQAAYRSKLFGPNAVVSHRARWLPVLWNQVRSPLLALLMAAAVTSAFVGQRSDAAIIGAIVAMSVGLGFVNEYRAERAAEALHSRITHQAVVLRDGRAVAVDVAALVPGDVVELRLGDIVPADVRLLSAEDLECDESILTGESEPSGKSAGAVAHPAGLGDLTGCALMGTVVHAGAGRGVVVATGAGTAFGAVAAGLGGRPGQTAFQDGLRRFSRLLVTVAGVLTTAIFVVNVVLQKPILDALLFSLAIAVGITPQLLPAVVSTSLAAGSRQLARRRVLVKRLVCIEDLGDVDTLFTDKTGTLTTGKVRFMRPVPAAGTTVQQLIGAALVCTDPEAARAGGAASGALDAALWASPATQAEQPYARGSTVLAALPFDHERRRMSVVARAPDGPVSLIVKGAPENVLPCCAAVPEETRTRLESEFGAGNRVIAVAARDVVPSAAPTPADEHDLRLLGLLIFLDAPKAGARRALGRFAELGVTVKIVTGDNPVVAGRVCEELGLAGGGTLTGADIDALDDAALAGAVPATTVFARVSPEQKARIVGVQRRAGGDVAFLGDGVNDALALHAADVGISVDSATDVAKDAADVILLEKDLGVLADGIVEGRRIFTNTIKYVLMGTSSNFGNMFSAAGASVFLSFLPMLPSQILLNNLLYDTSQLAIPTDTVDAEQLRRPSHWDIGFIRRFMLGFGPLSSVFDFLTFAVLLLVMHAGAAEFRSGWFVESLATQTLIIFAIRTRRTPFFRSRPSVPLLLAALGVVTVGAVLPATPVADTLGFGPLPLSYYAVLALFVVVYLGAVEVAKRAFYRRAPQPVPAPRMLPERHLRRRAARFSTRAGRPARPAG